MDIYYNAGFGCIVCPKAHLGNTPMRVVIEPVTVLGRDFTSEQLGEAVLCALESFVNASSRKECWRLFKPEAERGDPVVTGAGIGPCWRPHSKTSESLLEGPDVLFSHFHPASCLNQGNSI